MQVGKCSQDFGRSFFMRRVVQRQVTWRGGGMNLCQLRLSRLSQTEPRGSYANSSPTWSRRLDWRPPEAPSNSTSMFPRLTGWSPPVLSPGAAPLRTARRLQRAAFCHLQSRSWPSPAHWLFLCLSLKFQNKFCPWKWNFSHPEPLPLNYLHSTAGGARWQQLEHSDPIYSCQALSIWPACSLVLLSNKIFYSCWETYALQSNLKLHMFSKY